MALQLRDTFKSFQEFHDKLIKFQTETCTQFSIRNSERLHADDSLSSTFLYSALRYTCKHRQISCKQGKTSHKVKAVDEQDRCRQSKPYKINCPVQLNVRLNRPRGGVPVLKITKLEMYHNHAVSKEIFQMYPEQRRFILDESDQTLLSSRAIKMSAKKAILEKCHGVSLLPSDIYNQGRRLNGVRMVRLGAVPSKFRYPPGKETESVDEVLVSERLQSDQGDRVPDLNQPQSTPGLKGTWVTITRKPQTQPGTTGGNHPTQPKPACSNSVISGPLQSQSVPSNPDYALNLCMGPQKKSKENKNVGKRHASLVSKEGVMDNDMALCSNADCDKEKKWLNLDLQNALIEEGRLKERIHYFQLLANIDVEWLRACLVVTDEKAKAELEKVFRLVKCILDEEEKEVQIKMEIEDDWDDYPDKLSQTPELYQPPPNKKVKKAVERRGRASPRKQQMATEDSPLKEVEQKSNDSHRVCSKDKREKDEGHHSHSLLYRRAHSPTKPVTGKSGSEQDTPDVNLNPIINPSVNDNESFPHSLDNITDASIENQNSQKRIDSACVSLPSGNDNYINKCFGESVYENNNSEVSSDDGDDESKSEGEETNRMSLVCAICEKSCTTIDGFEIHMKRAHTRQQLFKCKSCYKTFETRRSLSDHMSQH